MKAAGGLDDVGGHAGRASNGRARDFLQDGGCISKRARQGCAVDAFRAQKLRRGTSWIAFFGSSRYGAQIADGRRNMWTELGLLPHLLGIPIGLTVAVLWGLVLTRRSTDVECGKRSIV
ncbi:MAG: hypothetical protein WCI05_06810 [Myxococcales bacterium]